MRLIVIEGVDGSGKSTQIKLLRNYLLEKKYQIEYLHFPRLNTPYFGELIARFLRGEFGSINEVDPQLVAMLYAGDRMDAAPLLRSWLNDGKVVLLDRYTFSNIAYQCAKVDDLTERERLFRWIFDLEFNHFAIPKPDLNIFLDVPFAFTEQNLSNMRMGTDRDYLCGGKDIHETSLDFQHKVREIYLSLLSKNENFMVVNCSNNSGEMLSQNSIFEKIIALIDSCLQ